MAFSCPKCDIKTGGRKHQLTIWVILEPTAGDKPEQNANSVGRLYCKVSSQAKLSEKIGRAWQYHRLSS
jgi:hypothetical protein